MSLVQLLVFSRKTKVSLYGHTSICNYQCCLGYTYAMVNPLVVAFGAKVVLGEINQQVLIIDDVERNTLTICSWLGSRSSLKQPREAECARLLVYLKEGFST